MPGRIDVRTTDDGCFLPAIVATGPDRASTQADVHPGANARTPRTRAGGPGAYRVGSGACLARWGPSREAVANICHQEHLPTALA